MLENGSFLISDYFQTRPQIEANIINATRMMLEDEFVPDMTAKFNQEISVVEGTLHQHTEKIGSLESKDKALDSATILLELELRREVNRMETKFDALITQKNREIEELRKQNENLKLKCDDLGVKTNSMVIAPLGTINAWVPKPSRSASSRTLPTCKKIIFPHDR